MPTVLVMLIAATARNMYLSTLSRTRRMVHAIAQFDVVLHFVKSADNTVDKISRN